MRVPAAAVEFSEMTLCPGGVLTLFAVAAVAVTVVLAAATFLLYRRRAGRTDARVCRGCATPHPPFARFCRHCGRSIAGES